MGLVCEIFRIDSLEIDQLLVQPQLNEELIDELEQKYNKSNTNQTVTFYIDKEWKICFEIMSIYLEKDYPELKNTFQMASLSKVISTEKVFQINKALDSLATTTLSKIDFFYNNSVEKKILVDGIMEVKRAFKKASSENQGVLISIG